MTTSRKLKIWTIITHAFIVVGFGHGIITLGFIEVFWFPYITKDGFTFFFNSSFEARLPTIGLLTLIGQASLACSTFTKRDRWALAFQLLGLLFLWLSIVYFVIYLSKEHYIQFGTLTAIPFLICTLIMFIGKPLKELYKWAIDE
jgi:hypothetical protein